MKKNKSGGTEESLNKGKGSSISTPTKQCPVVDAHRFYAEAHFTPEYTLGQRLPIVVSHGQVAAHVH